MTLTRDECESYLREFADLRPFDFEAPVRDLALAGHEWPEAVVLRAAYIALREFWERIDGAVLTRAHKEIRGAYNRDTSAALTLMRKHHGDASVRSIVAERELANRIFDDVTQDLAHRVQKRRPGRPHSLQVELRKLFMEAGLPRRSADAHARELKRCLASITRREREPWPPMNNSTRG